MFSIQDLRVCLYSAGSVATGELNIPSLSAAPIKGNFKSRWWWVVFNRVSNTRIP